MPKSLTQLTGAEAEVKATADILQTTPLVGQQAMLNTMKEYPSPREWAAFVLVGQ